MRFLNTPVTDLTYDDAFLVPSSSATSSRFDVDLAAPDPTGSTIPLVAANMTAVTGKRMVESMARRGGLAVLPQDLPLEVVARETDWVKARPLRFLSARTFRAEDTVHDARARLGEYAHGSVLVVDDDGRLLGLVQEPDCQEADSGASLRSVMRTDLPAIPEQDLAVEGIGAAPSSLVPTMAAVSQRLAQSGTEVAPVVSAEGIALGVITSQAAVRATIYAPSTDADGRLRVAAAIGINGDVEGRARALVEAGVDVLVVDTAHGHQRKMLQALETVRTVAASRPIVAGNVVTADGVRDLLGAGADIVKVGVGPGAMCTTRMMTAVGRPQLSAVLECAEAAAELGGSVWADGGVKHPRDAALALAAGASQVMVGSWFAGTHESPGELRRAADGRLYKESFGMASTRAVLARTEGLEAFERSRRAMFEEGISSSRMYLDPRRPGVEDLIDHLTAGVRSSMTYAGASDLPEFADRAVLGIQSRSGYEEGRARSESWS